MKNLLLLLAFALMLCSCASGSAVLTGTARPETNPEDVEILGEYPADYEVIGLVTASSDAGLTAEGDLEYAREEICRQAASLGANAVILEGTAEDTDYAYTGTMLIASTSHSISGKALYVYDFTPKRVVEEAEKKRLAKAKAKKAKAEKAKAEKQAKEQQMAKKTAKNVHVAIVETVSSGVTKTNENQYLTNVLREEAVKALPSRRGFTVMTRENISAMLPPDVAIEDCEGSCLVETGRNIAADYIAQARIDTFGENLTISVELYKTSNGRLISSFNAKSPNVDQLESEIRNKASDMYIEVMKTELGE